MSGNRFVSRPRPGCPLCLWIWPRSGNTGLSELSSPWRIKPLLCQLVITIAYVWTFHSCAVKGIRSFSVRVVLGACIQSIYLYVYMYMQYTHMVINILCSGLCDIIISWHIYIAHLHDREAAKDFTKVCPPPCQKFPDLGLWGWGTEKMFTLRRGFSWRFRVGRICPTTDLYPGLVQGVPSVCRYGTRIGNTLLSKLSCYAA